MTNKEAIMILKSTSVNLGRRGGRTAYDEALEMAITALENAKNDNLTSKSAQNVQKQAFKMQKSDVLGVKTGETCSDTISRQAALYAIYEICNEPVAWLFRAAREIEKLPSVQSETCDTCKHGYFGDERCNDCRVRFTSHYERRTDD